MRIPFSDKDVVKELGKHGPTPLVMIALFVLIVVAGLIGSDSYVVLPGLVLILLAYYFLRRAEIAAAERAETLPVAAAERKLQSVVESHRAGSEPLQPPLPLGPPGRRPKPRTGSEKS